MFQYLNGEIVEISKDFFILESGNAGYKIFAPSTTIQKLIINHEINKIYTYVQMREDSWVIYGFKTKVELHAFELLLTVSGVGPKVACGILSGSNPRKIAMMITGGDSKSLSKLPGIGPKTAQRIILELKDKPDLLELATSFRDESGKASDTNQNTADGAEGDEAENLWEEQDSIPNGGNNVSEEAIEALISLGYTVAEAKNAVSACFDESSSLEVIIKKSLTYIGRKR